MSTSLLALIAATLVLVAIPGPNVALIVANSIRYGFRSGVATVIGTTTGVAVQLLLVVSGLAALVATVAEALTWIRWAGVAYLLWLGLRTWFAEPEDLAAIEARPAMFWRGCLVAVLNPKTLLFHAAFIPQFVDPGASTLSASGIVAGAFLAVLTCGDLLWAAFATSARSLLVRYASVRNRLVGLFLAAAGLGLAFARR